MEVGTAMHTRGVPCVGEHWQAAVPGGAAEHPGPCFSGWRGPSGWEVALLLPAAAFPVGWVGGAGRWGEGDPAGAPLRQLKEPSCLLSPLLRSLLRIC